MNETDNTYGLLACFDKAQDLLNATRQADSLGYTHMDAYTPHPVDGLAQALHYTPKSVVKAALISAVLVAVLAYALQVYSVFDYPFHVSDRPPFSWPVFVIPTVALSMLAASFGAFFGMLTQNALPTPYHPVFNYPDFIKASKDTYFLCIEASDPIFSKTQTHAFLETMRPLLIVELEKVPT